MSNIHDTDCQKVLDEINALREKVKNNSHTEDELKIEHSYLFENFEILFGKICKDPSDVSYNRIISMINYVYHIQKGDISQHKASEEIGTELAVEYIYSKLPDFNPEKDLKK